MSLADVQQKCNTLRQDLKGWEKQFAAQNDGRKAGREDIKANAEISLKYKEYNKLRSQLSTKIAPQTPSRRTSSRPSIHDVEEAPTTRPMGPLSAPPKKSSEEGLGDHEVQFLDIPSPEGPSFIGPTPQRNGIVLGLFDLSPAQTPSKQRSALGDVEVNIFQTPSRKLKEPTSETSLESRVREVRTPLSTGKKFLLHQFVTPQKRRLEEECSPTSVMRALSTPAFLRRNNVPDAIEESNETTPRPAPWKRRGLGRSLSAMIQAMRKDEDDRLDEEADIMREMEMEEQGISVPQKSKKAQILVEDSQVQMPLGPDRGLESEDEEEEGKNLYADGKPRKVWKKKGLKRQTKRVIMRPNFMKPKLPLVSFAKDDVEDEANVVDQSNTESDSENESDYANEGSHMPKRQKESQKNNEKLNTTTDTKDTEKPRGRKIKATANANYQRLKIKGKAGNGKRGKFGRRR